MPIPEFEFTHPLGHRDVNHYLQNPPSEEIWRDYLNEMPFEIRTYLKETVKAYLDDYLTHKADIVTDADGAHGLKIEKGTFTPLIKFGGATVGITYLFDNGSYTKIDNMVHFEIDIVLSSKGTSTGSMTLEGLPFVSNAARPRRAFAVGAFENITIGTKTVLGASLDISASLIKFIALGNASVQTVLDNTAFTNDSNFRFAGSYRI